jgi:protein Tex
VLGVDIARKRISLTMRLDDEPDGRGADSSGRTGRGSAATSRERTPAGAPRPGPPHRPGGPQRGAGQREGDGRGDNRRNEPPGNSAMADALRRAGLAGGASGGAGSAGNGKPLRDDGRGGR